MIIVVTHEMLLFSHQYVVLVITRRSSDCLFLGIISSMSCDITKAEFSLYNAYQKTNFFANLVCRWSYIGYLTKMLIGV